MTPPRDFCGFWRRVDIVCRAQGVRERILKLAMLIAGYEGRTDLACGDIVEARQRIMNTHEENWRENLRAMREAR